MVKIGAVLAVSFNADNYNEVVRDSFKDVIQGGKDFKVLCAFEHYINGHPFDFVFDTVEAYEKWVIEYEWRYFLIPLELVPAISHYADFVKTTFPELIFDVVLQRQAVTVGGVVVEVPTTMVKMIPCNCTHWTDEGLQLLDAVIENWNTSYPGEVINFQYKFETFDEFKAFRDSQIQVL